jgi:hypothetical protein
LYTISTQSASPATLTAANRGSAALTTPDPSSIRLDALALRPPRQLDDGTRVYDAALVYAGRPLQYGWGTEIPTAEALADKAYLDGFKGLSVVVHHPPSLRVDNGQVPKQGNGKRVGTAFDARFDATEGAVIVSLAVHEPSDQREVERLRNVSEGYRAETQPVGHRVAVQTKRTPNHIAITDTPRADGAQIRVDEHDAKESPMAAETKQFDIADALRMIGEADARTATEKVRADTAEAKVVKLEGDITKAASDKVAADKTRADAQEAEIDRLANERVVELLKLKTRADSLGVKIPETAITLADRKAALAKALGCPDGTDAEAFIAATEKVRADSKGKSSADRFIASAKTEGADRADSNEDVAWPV